jgi:peptidoglycan hydrolase-like protein with peptidoglycan-binding domain
MVRSTLGVVGNRAVLRLIEGEPAGDVATGEPEPADNPLVGLQRNDGMTNETIPLRPRVKQLQSALNQRMQSELVPDGKFGGMTARVLGDFQEGRGMARAERVDKETADALLGRNQGPKPPPKPPEQELNPELESRLEAIHAEYQIIVLRARDGLTALERDLGKEEHHSFAKDLLKAAVEGALGVMLGPEAGLLAIPIHAAFQPKSEHDKSLAQAGVDGVLDKMLEKAIERGVEAIEELLTTKGPSLSAFIDAQRDALLNAASAGQQEFLLNGKAKFREPVPDMEPGTGINDPRVLKANEFLRSLKLGTKGAANDQYTTSLARWGSLIAQSKGHLGAKQVDGKTVTDLSKREHSDGVLLVTVEGADPGEHLRVTGIKLTGFPEPALRRLEKQGTIGELQLPRQAVGHVKGGVDEIDRPIDGEIFITKNEVNVAQDIGNDGPGHAWLRSKGAREIIIDSKARDLAQLGAAEAWHEIDGHDLKDGDIKT